MMHTILRKLPVILSFLILVCGQAQTHAQTVDLKLNPAPGEKYTYFFDYNSNIEMAQGTIKMDIGVGLTMELTGTEGAYKLMKATYDRMVMKMNMGDNNMDIDTDKAPGAFDPNDPMSMVALLFKGLKGQFFMMKVDAAGELVEITGFEKIVENMVETSTGGTQVPDQVKQGMRDGMSKQFNAESMKEQLGQTFNIFPGKPVKVGESWVKNIQTQGSKKMKTTNTYTVQSIGEQEVVLALHCVVDEMVTEEGMTMNGTQDGTLRVDPRSGMLINSEITQALSGTGAAAAKINGKATTTRK